MREIRCIFLLSFILCMGAATVGAQNPATGEYELKVQFESFKNVGNDMINIEYGIYAGEDERMVVLYRTGRVNSGRNIFYDNQKIVSLIFSAAKKPSKLKFYEKRRWNIAVGTDSKKYKNIFYTIAPNSYTDIVISHADGGGVLFPACDTKLRVILRPVKIDIAYFNSKGVADGTYYLPDADNITLKATRGLTPLSTYDWQYRVEGEDPIDSWRSFPAQYQNKDEIKFKGTDIFSPTEFQTITNNRNNIQVRVNTLTRQNPTKPYLITLSTRPSAPHISNAEVYELEKCHGSGDARVRITFDRPLVSGENVAVKIDNQIPYGGGNYTSFDETNSIIIENVEAGSRTLAVSGTYNGDAMYTASSSHSKTITVANRPKITHGIVGVREVSCYGGSDGEIIADAGGGNGNFTGRLYLAGQSEVIQEVAFRESEFATFGRLAVGNYEVRISDTNGCIAYAGNGDVLVHQVTIGQPAQPVKVTLEYILKPLAFDSHDGKVTVRVSGGTPAQNGYVAVLTHDGGQSYTPASRSADGNDILYTFGSLPQGNYFVTIQDKNFASLDPQDRIDPCGCSAVLNFLLDAPPPIAVEIEETHFINWHGGDQGELTAHATGGIRLSSSMPYQYAWYKQSEAGIMQPAAIPSDSIARNLTAGAYQVKVTDANGISKLSGVYNLVQPDPIRVQFTTVQTGCQGGSSGKVTAIVSGGVEPYRYQWNVEGAATNEITSLEAGVYILKITDVRGGQLLSNAEVTSASSLKVDSLIVQPSCVALGSIRLQLSGATAPYTVRWDDTNSADLIRNELMPDIYRVSITDANNCVNTYTFILKEPRRFAIDLGGDLVMCRNQTRILEAVCDEPDVVYEWHLNGTKLPDTGARITVDREGTYGVKATNLQGCFASDQINVRITGETLELDMTVPTVIESGSEIHAVNLSKVTADRIEWKLPAGAAIIRQSDTELVFSLAQKGSHTISMEGFKGEGATIVTRTISVVGKGEVTLPDSEKPLIKQFWVTPNPSTGYFKVVVELNQAEDFTMLLFSPQGVEMDRKEVAAVQSKTFEYEINGSLQGTYLLHLITKADKSVLQIVIKK